VLSRRGALSGFHDEDVVRYDRYMGRPAILPNLMGKD
jgi:hypothetical protein